MTTPPDKPTPTRAPKRRRKFILSAVLLGAVAIGGVIAACSSQVGTVRKHSVASGTDGELADAAPEEGQYLYELAPRPEHLRRERDSFGSVLSLSPGTPPPPPPAADARASLRASERSVGAGLNQAGRGGGGSHPNGQSVSPSFVNAPGEELWIISRTPETGQARPRTLSPDNPGSGCLVGIVPGQTEQVPIPLEHTEVGADIRGYISAVGVQQRFHNPFDTKIEAVYVFPLPQNSAINEFLMTVGDRTIRGIIREREEAEEIYANARARGHVASLMTQERPNIFTQRVANIEPGKSIDIDITYFQTLRYDNDAWEFVFPMVVGPRFNPPGSTDGVGAAPRGSDPGATGQATQISYLARRAQRARHRPDR
ncbi:MAG: VIT domain-containing protein [Phycisphaerales bacterium]